MDTTTNDSSSNLFSVTPFEAATWQLPHLAHGTTRCQVALPALQRGAVWRPKQVEALWDSLIRGFPIGSFLLAPYEQHQGTRDPRYGTAPHTVCYHLLDGQQRWNAITLGFVNIWQPHPTFRAELDALWVDLAPPEALTDGREFIFRVATRSHPWGYRRDDPNSRLNAQNRREALEAYECAHQETHQCTGTGCDINFRPGKLPLLHAWPWDAIAPVPFAFIAEAVKAGTHDTTLWETVCTSMECLPYWNANELHNHSGRRNNPNNWKKAVLTRLAAPTQHMTHLIQGVRRNLGIDSTAHYRVPVLKLPRARMTTVENADRTERPDALETLFVRVNAEGTRLEGEELNYSILKSIYPQAETLVYRLSTGLMPPARLVTFISRLVLANLDSGQTDATPPPEPNVARFRRLVQDSAFARTMRSYIGLNESGNPMNGKGYAATLLQQAQDLVTWSENTEASYRLPSVLVTDLARHSQDAFFLLLMWLDRMSKAKQTLDIDDATKRRIVGGITTLGWFALKPDKCLETLWKLLHRPESDPKKFFAPVWLEVYSMRQATLLRQASRKDHWAPGRSVRQDVPSVWCACVIVGPVCL